MTAMLIPCAGNIAIDMQAEFGPIPAALLPVGKDFALIEALKPVVGLYDQIFVGFSRPQDLVQNAVNRHHKNVEIVDVGETRSLGETILQLLKVVPKSTSAICIQMGDAFHPGFKRGRDTVYYSMEAALNRWVSFSFDEQQGVHDVKMPGTSKNPSLGTAFAGKFEMSDAGRFGEILKEELSAPVQKIDPFYRAVIKYFNSRGNFVDLLSATQDWIDFGYSSSYFDYRRKVGFNSRSFNSLRFDEVKKSVIKRSENRAKLAEEIAWFSHLPGDLADLYPRIYAVGNDSADPWIETEYSVALPLDQLYMYSKLDEAVWIRIFVQLRFALERFSKHSSVAQNVALSRNLGSMCEEIYSVKTLARLRDVVNDPRFSDFLEDGLIINDVVCFGLRTIAAQLLELVQKFLSRSAPIPSLIHGDLCFSNILYDHRLDHVRLIDPRGSFGQHGAMGDLRYDLAKLLHSAEGNYDFLVNEHFEMSSLNRKISLRTLKPDRSKTVVNLCGSLVRNFVGEDLVAVRFIESLLFLSMIPLHADRLNVQKAFLATGLKQFSETVREMGFA